MQERHFQATANQISHERVASQDRRQFASVNGGRPQTPAMNQVNERHDNQQARIANGRLTEGERQQVNREQNTDSRNIARDKHNEERERKQACHPLGGGDFLDRPPFLPHCATGSL